MPIPYPVYAENGNDLVWGNSGNDTFEAQPSSTHDTFDGGPGTDTADFSSPMASYTITRTGADTFTINALDNSTQTNLAEIEFAQFSDQTLDLSTVPMPEPSTLCLLASGITALLMRPRNRTLA